MQSIELKGILGANGDVNCFIGFAPANLLYQHSFADVLDEKSGKGYQRRFNDKHSFDFRNYIQEKGSSTVPLTFNLKQECAKYWRIKTIDGADVLRITEDEKVFSQVDCQHRLGYLADLEVSLPFMTYIGLTQKEEMAVFNVINAKAKGLSGSLIDFHETKLVADIEKLKPELVLAVRLNDDAASPWYKMLDLGGKRTSGLQRRASLRTMQKAIRHFLRNLGPGNSFSQEELYEIILSFWLSVSTVLEEEWQNPRTHMICKGVGVYSLMNIASDICKEKSELPHLGWDEFIRLKFGSFANDIDWSNKGPLRGLGGEGGVSKATEILRNSREKSKLKVIINAK